MYANYEQKIINGYIALHIPDHSLAKDSPGMFGWVYEHRMIAEEMLGRKLLPDEDVHHLDNNRLNNSPDNLLILSRSQHIKLHSWLKKNVIVPKPRHAIRTFKGCIRCKTCTKPIDHNMVYCSTECQHMSLRVVERPSPDVLLADLQQLSMVKVGKKYGVSDNAIRKWATTANINLAQLKA